MTGFVRISNKLLKSVKLNQLMIRNINLAGDERGGEKVRFYKKIFATGLFAATLTTAVYLRKQKESQSLFDQTKGIKKKFGLLQLFEFEGFILPQEIIQALPKLLKFEFRSDDIVLMSFPKTGKSFND